MNFTRRLLLLVALLLPASPALAEGPEETYRRVNVVVLPAFPPGTQGYEMYWVAGRDPAASVETLVRLLAAAKRQQARWVIASDDEAALRANLMAAFERSERSRRIRTEIVVASPLAGDEALAEAARRVGASLEFIVLPPADAASGLRLWKSVALLDGVEGIVVTPGRVSFHAGADPASAREVASVETPAADEVLAKVETWVELDGAQLTCARVKDGWGLRVEGEARGRGFAFSAHVPNLCAEGAAREAADTYARLEALRGATAD